MLCAFAAFTSFVFPRELKGGFGLCRMRGSQDLDVPICEKPFGVLIHGPGDNLFPDFHRVGTRGLKFAANVVFDEWRVLEFREPKTSMVRQTKLVL